MPYPGFSTFPGATTYPGTETVTTAGGGGGMTWLNVADPAVRSAVVSGGWGRAPHSGHDAPPADPAAIDLIADALAIASQQLSVLTGFGVHPAGTAVEEFVAVPRARSLTLFYSPVRTVQTVMRIAVDGTATTLAPSSGTWVLFAGKIRFTSRWVSRNADRYCAPAVDEELIQVTYRFGSTITQHARAAVLELAHEHWLQSNPCDECGACRLPDSTVNVTREGISMELESSESRRAFGRTGLPGVDAWIAGVNPRQALRRSGVYDPESPPGVVRSVQGARPTWAA